MPTSPVTSVIQRLRRTALLRESAALGDAELLGCFIERHDEAALAALIKRHGPMIWGVCRRLLSHHDAEDAFQAAFLVLVRKAATVAPREMLANWLYGVAHRAALLARRAAARRRAREVQVATMPDTEAAPHDQWPDVQPLLDQELTRLDVALPLRLHEVEGARLGGDHMRVTETAEGQRTESVGIADRVHRLERQNQERVGALHLLE